LPVYTVLSSLNIEQNRVIIIDFDCEQRETNWAINVHVGGSSVQHSRKCFRRLYEACYNVHPSTIIRSYSTLDWSCSIVMHNLMHFIQQGFHFFNVCFTYLVFFFNFWRSFRYNVWWLAKEASIWICKEDEKERRV
jgi:hypothetical protein